jgi:xanthine dehydrogenase large subunit
VPYRDHLLGLDPLTVRERNYYAANGATETGRGTLTPYGQPVDDFCLQDMTARLCDTSDYHNRQAQIAEWNSTSDTLKKGLALTPVKFGISFTLTHLNQAGALVHVYQDGSVHLNHGGTEMGQGLFQKVAQVAAARFGIDVSQVKITATDTGKVPNTSATAASSGSDLNGMAVQAACDTLRARMADLLAQEHQCDVAQVVFQDGMVTVAGATYSFAEVAQKAYLARISLSATGFYKTPKVQWDRIRGQGRPFFYFAYGVAATEMVIDTLTGENRILRTDILHDAGASLNPGLDIGQIEGGYVQGAGWLTTEELVWDAKGRLRTHAPSTYKIPACSDRPDVFNVALWDAPNREDTVYRSKAVGEPPFMLGISAYAALSRAVQACGPHYADLQAPATAEEVFARRPPRPWRGAVLMSFDRSALIATCAAQGRVARVVVARVRGSAPREVGAAMLVWQDGFSGTIGGGTLEHEAMVAARAQLDKETSRLSRHALGPDLGQCCGGRSRSFHRGVRPRIGARPCPRA